MLYLIDSAAILNDENFYFEESKEYVTTSLIAEELKGLRPKALLDNALKQGFLSIQDPSKEYNEKLSEFLEKIGDERLSKADSSLIALAWELKDKGKKLIVLSDDFSVQNALKHLNIPFKGVIMGEIGKKIHFTPKKRPEDY